MMMFVGVGGSGAKTLAYLHRRLLSVAQSAGFEKVPAAWQFVAIDLPPDLEDADKLGYQLPPDSYEGLAPPVRNYRSYDGPLASGPREVRREFGSWRPNPANVHQPLHKGAGQYRTIGRVVVLESLDTVYNALHDAATTYQHDSTRQEFNSLMQALGRPAYTKSPAPHVFVVGSVAGGSGSGTLLDVCDMLRAMGTAVNPWLRETSAVIYTPDVFQNFDDNQRRGTEPNALAGVNELLAGFYDESPDSPHLEHAGILGAPDGYRGPKYSFFVGSSNGHVGYSSDHQIYEATARMLEALALEEDLQQSFDRATTGNRAQSAATPDSNPMRPADQEKPAVALGFARLSLGRDIFQAYASERGAKALVRHLVYAHRDIADRRASGGLDVDRISRDAQLDLVIDQAMVENFIESCGLNEQTRENNQVLEAIMPKEEVDSAAEGLAGRVLKKTRGRERGEQRGRFWLDRFESTLADEEKAFLHGSAGSGASGQVGRIREAAEALAAELPGRVLATVYDHLASYGLPVTCRLLSHLRTSLERVVREELPAERTTLEGSANTILGSMTGEKKVQKVVDRRVKLDNPALSPVMEAIAKRRVAARTKIELRTVAIDVLREFLDDVLTPLEESLAAAHGELSRFVGSSRYGEWSEGAVPERLAPLSNEVTVDQVSDMPDQFVELLRQAVGTKGDPMPKLATSLLDDDALRHEDRERLALLSLSEWQPSFAGAVRTAPVSVVAGLSPDRLVERVQSWMARDLSSGIGAYVSESLGDYLSLNGGSSKEREDRTAHFAERLDAAIRMAQPLVIQNPEVLRNLHSLALNPAGLPSVALALTPIPIPKEHPARDAAEQVLSRFGVGQERMDGFFASGGGGSSITVSTQSEHVHPLAFYSLTEPIASRWAKRSENPDLFATRRRARRLIESVPLPKQSTHKLIAGWFAGVWLGEAGFDGSEKNVVDDVWVFDDEGERLPLPTEGAEGTANDDSDVLPMILDAYGIVDVSAQHGQSGLAGYERLFELGHGRELCEWVEQGEISGGRAASQRPGGGADPGSRLPTADEGGAGAAGDRQQRLLAWLEDEISTFDTLVRVEPSESYTGMTRRWDLAPEMVIALRELHDLVSRVATNRDGTVGQPGRGVGV